MPCANMFYFRTLTGTQSLVTEGVTITCLVYRSGQDFSCYNLGIHTCLPSSSHIGPEAVPTMLAPRTEAKYRSRAKNPQKYSGTVESKNILLRYTISINLYPKK